MPDQSRKDVGEPREETRKRLSNLPDDAVNVGEMDAGGRPPEEPVKEGEKGEKRAWLAGPMDEARKRKK